MVFRYLDETQTWQQEQKPAARMPQARNVETGMSNHSRPRLSESRYYSLPVKEPDASSSQPRRPSSPYRFKSTTHSDQKSSFQPNRPY